MQTMVIGCVPLSLAHLLGSRADPPSAARSYAPLRERLEREGKPVVIMPELQEVNALPCDTGSVRPRSIRPPFPPRS